MTPQGQGSLARSWFQPTTISILLYELFLAAIPLYKEALCAYIELTLTNEYTPTMDIDSLKEWLQNRTDDDIYEGPILECSVLIYRSRLFGSGLASVINGGTTPATFKSDPCWFKFDWLIEVIGRETGRERSAWLKVHGDRAYSYEIAFLQEYSFEKGYSADKNQYFDCGKLLGLLDNGAKTLILVAESKRWWLEISNDDELEIYLHGSDTFCKKICQVLEIDVSPCSR